MTPIVADERVRAYVDAVRARLADLPADEREHLLSDTEAALLEEEGSFEQRLGPPDRFADELRAAAGLAALEPPARGRSLSELLAPVSRLANELAPAWWVVRAYVLLALATWVLGDDWSTRQPVVPRLASSTVLTIVAGLVVLAASIAVGRRERGRAALAVNVALLVAAIPLVDHLARAPVPVEFVDVVYEAPSGLALDGKPVANIYPYSRDGRLLYDVRLFDADGRPLNVRANDIDPNRRPIEDRSGAVVYNAFPIRFFDRGTRRISRPAAGAPKQTLPKIITEPVRTHR